MRIVDTPNIKFCTIYTFGRMGKIPTYSTNELFINVCL